ncbi:(2Fe-2S)-binding protein [Sneathiella sp.]|jgi:carbon-monoxide dehydrogenase small subunit|uniref:(2Fe-2S)-binding protein n=1 Tax=Sneathiella sp. TaxID=1964365 RepID=UPI0039E2DE1A
MDEDPSSPISMTVNTVRVEAEISDRMLLSDFIRQYLNLTGTHVGCDTSQCGACVVHLNGHAVKSCSLLAQQANGATLTTIEGIGSEANPHPMQKAFQEKHGLQCGFCTPGMIMTALDICNRHPGPLEEDIIKEELEGNICRCTGYLPIIEAIKCGADQQENTDRET